MSDNHQFNFVEPNKNSSNAVQSVKDMVAQVIFALAQSGGTIGQISFESRASQGGYFYIGHDEISDQTIKLHGRDLIQLAPHFAPDAKVMIYATCGNVFNDMAKYMLANFWPGVSVRSMNTPVCRSSGGHHNHHRRYRSGHGSRFDMRW